MKAGSAILLLLMFGILALPFLLRKEGESILNPDGRVVIITPHNEAIRYEFGQAFRRWYFERTGQTVIVDWRVIGGTSEIVRKIEGDYLNAFRNYWVEELGREWSMEVQNAFYNRRLQVGPDPGADTPGQAARRAFLTSGVSSGLDVFFGGGSYDFIRQANSGSLVSFGLLERRPDWFGDDTLPQSYAGEPFWDPEGRWFGAVLSTFGIIFNRDGLRRVGYEGIPSTWRDLADPRFIGEVALADPTKSGSITKAFEMIVQKEMQDLELELRAKGVPAEEAEARAVAEGWDRAMRLIVLIAANARYFTDSATKPPLDVSQGDCVVGMAIDFYGRQQAEFNMIRGGSDRFGYVAPEGATTVSVDPIALFRGAPNRENGEAFIEFVMSKEGQKLWNFRPGTPGGPRQYALRRSPARRELYEERFLEFRSDPEVNDYETADGFHYRAEWTGALFSALRYSIRVAMIDPHDELRRAWAAIIATREAGREADTEAALAVLQNIEKIGYDEARGRISGVLGSRDPIEEVRLSKELSAAFRAQYNHARRLAQGEGN